VILSFQEIIYTILLIIFICIIYILKMLSTIKKITKNILLAFLMLIFFDRKNTIAEEIQLITSAPTFKNSFSISNLTPANKTLYFVEVKIDNNKTAISPLWGYLPGFDAQIWKYSNNQLTKITNIINSKDTGFNPSDLITIDDTLYFTGEDNEHGRELWKYNKNGLQVIDISPGSTSSGLMNLTIHNDELYFTMGNSLYKYNRDGVNKVASMPKNGFPFGSLFNFRNKIFFSVKYNDFDGGLWKYDGQSFSADLNVLNNNNGKYSTYAPSNFIVFNNDLYFYLEDGYELWKYDGKTTSLVMKIIGRSYEARTNLAVFKNALYFRADDNIHGNELWKYDGKNTFLITDLREGKQNSNPTYMTVFNNQLYFVAENNRYGWDLWKYDGIKASKVKYSNIDYDIGNPSKLAATRDGLYFVTQENNKNEKLWKLTP
jgi:ELWxxDGT repeat protein